MHYSTIAFDPIQGVFLPVPEADPAQTGHLARLLDACARACARAAAPRGDQVEPAAARLALACAEACRSAARVLSLDVPCHRAVCEGCAELCAAVARDTDDVVLARLCRRCADGCRAVAAG